MTPDWRRFFQEPPIDWEPPAKAPRGAAARAPVTGVQGGRQSYGSQSAASVGASSLAGYQMAAAGGGGQGAKSGNAAFAMPAYHPLLPKSTLLNSLGYSVLPTASTFVDPSSSPYSPSSPFFSFITCLPDLERAGRYLEFPVRFENVFFY